MNTPATKYASKFEIKHSCWEGDHTSYVWQKNQQHEVIIGETDKFYKLQTIDLHAKPIVRRIAKTGIRLNEATADVTLSPVAEPTPETIPVNVAEPAKPVRLLDIRQVPESVLFAAVQTMFSECYGAMRIANYIGGQQTPKWELLHAFDRAEIMSEVEDRKLDITKLTTAVGKTGELVINSVAYKKMYA